MKRKILIYFLVLGILAGFFGTHTQTKAADITVICAQGYYTDNSPFTSAPTFDYGTDGLVRFHFTLNPTGWGPISFYQFRYSQDCTFNGLYGYTWENSNQIPSGISRLMLKAVSSNGTQPPYSFAAFDEDTGQQVDIGPGPIVSLTDPVVAVGFLIMRWYGNTGALSPAVPIVNPNPVVTKIPVLIVPGILGTELKNGDDLIWADIARMVNPLNDDSFMDPLAYDSNLVSLGLDISIDSVIREKSYGPFHFDYANGLIDLLSTYDVGYTEGQDLFTFPYDWRYGVSSEVVNQLKGQIEYILTQTEAGRATGKVDIVAHSTGGLVVKKYIKDNPDTHGIGKAIFVGVPNLGAPKAFKVLINGDNFGILGLNGEEMKKIGQNMPVVYDLAPSPLYDSEVGKFLKVSNPLESLLVGEDVDYSTAIQRFKEQNLVNNLALTNSQNLHSSGFDNYDIRNNGVDVYNIVGCKSGTFGKFSENIQSDGTSVYDFPKLTTGDGTVPLLSAQTIPADPSHVYFAPNADHSKMLSIDGIRQKIVNLILSNADLNTGNKILTQSEVQNRPDLCQIKGEQIKIKSPVKISVIDQYGNLSGLAEDGSIQNNIPGADYEVWGEHKYVFIPTDNGQVYEISLKGTGEGTFTLQDERIDNGNTVQTQVFSNIPVSTSLTARLDLNSTGTAELKIDGQSDGVFEQSLQPSAVVDSSQSQDLVAPVTTPLISGTQGQPGFYSSSVNIALSALDVVIPGRENETSGVLRTYYDLDNLGYQTYIDPIDIIDEGQHTIKYFSTDKAGNNEEVKTIIFIIDKIPPEYMVSFNRATKDFEIEGVDNSGQTPIIFCETVKCTLTDQAGNTTDLLFQTQTFPLLKTKTFKLKSVDYNGQVSVFDPNLLSVTYTLSGGNVANFSQTELIKNQQIMNITYNQKKNQSIITDLTKGTNPQISTVPGIKILQILINKGILKVIIK